MQQLPREETEALANLVCHVLECGADATTSRHWNAMFERWEIIVHDDPDTLIELHVTKTGAIEFHLQVDRDFRSVADFCEWYTTRQEL